MRFSFVIAWLPFYFALTGCSTLLGNLQPEDLQLVHREAQEAFDRGEDTRAEVLYKKLTMLMPQSAESWLRLGNIYARNNNDQLAVETYRKALALSINDARIWSNLGVVLLRQAWAAMAAASEASAPTTPAFRISQEVMEALKNVPYVLNQPELKVSQASAPKPVSQVVSVLPPPTATAPAPAPAPALSRLAQFSDGPPPPDTSRICDLRTQQSVELSPARPVLRGDRVVLQAQFETSVCLIDATGKSWAASLKANESKNYDGVPPWRVFGADLPNIQVFYQGQLMRVQNQSVILKEAPGSFSGLLQSGSTQPASR